MKNNSILNITKPSVATERHPQSSNEKSQDLPKEQTKEQLAPQSFEELYLAKNYKGAAQYLLNNKQHFESGIFYFNLGTVYSKMGDFPVARFHLEKAIQEGYINSATLNNLGFVKSQMNSEDLSTSSALPDQIVNYMSSMPKAGYLSLSLIFILVSLILIKSKSIQKKWLIGFVLFLSITPFLWSHYYAENLNRAIALNEVVIYEGPSKIFNEKGKLRSGSKVILGEFKDGWFFIEFPISLAGWVNKDQLGLY